MHPQRPYLPGKAKSVVGIPTKKGEEILNSCRRNSASYPREAKPYRVNSLKARPLKVFLDVTRTEQLGERGRATAFTQGPEESMQDPCFRPDSSWREASLPQCSVAFPKKKICTSRPTQTRRWLVFQCWSRTTLSFTKPPLYHTHSLSICHTVPENL